ncbi:DNA polymerase III subunit beta [Patescibacteria group bacterium]
MKILILKNKLKKGLDIVERVASKSLTLPTLNNVLLSVEKNFLNLTTTNLEIGINYWVLIKAEKEGKIAIPASLLSGFVNFLPEEKISLEVKNKVLYIESKNHKTQIKGFDPEEFPIIPKVNKEECIEVNAIPFCQGLSQVVEIVAPTQIRPEISGVYLSFQKDQVLMATTDSFRLAEKKLSYQHPSSSTSFKERSLILPQKTVRELINVFSEKKEKIKIYFSSNQIMFESLMPEISQPQLQIVSRLIEGEYPNYQEIIPKKYQTQIILQKNEFLNQLKTASLFSGKINEIKVKANLKEKRIEIFTQNPDLGENQSFLSGTIKGEKTEVSFNWRFLLDGVLNLNGKEVIFELNDEGGPAVLKSVGDSSYLYVLMPIKTS